MLVIWDVDIRSSGQRPSGHTLHHLVHTLGETHEPRYSFLTKQTTVVCMAPNFKKIKRVFLRFTVSIMLLKKSLNTAVKFSAA